MTGVTKRGKKTVLTRAAIVAAVVLALGVGGLALAGITGTVSPVPSARHAVLDFGSLAQNPFGPAPVDRPSQRSRTGKPAPRPAAPRTRAHPGGKTAPGVGRVCGRRQANRIQTTPRGTLVCANMGSGRHRWVKVNGVDPQLRKPGNKCTGQYTTARSPRGLAMQCARGRWTYGA